jgi:CSLREA domain-containing protein
MIADFRKSNIIRNFFRYFTVVILAIVVVFLLNPESTRAADIDLSNGITVDSTLDSVDNNVGDGQCNDGVGNCTLRAAIEEANSNADTSTINFNISGAPDFTISGQSGYTIFPSTQLPIITETTIVNGYSQPGAQPNSSNAPEPMNGVLLIEIDGSNIGGATGNGLNLSANVNDSIFSGLVINSFPEDGIALQGADEIIITGNYIGTDPTGIIGKGNGSRGIGSRSELTSDDIRVGGLLPSERNLISDNNDSGGSNGNEGIAISGGSINWTVQGNYIGIDSTGLSSLGNEDSGVGTSGSGASDILIGGTEFGSTNVVSGNYNGLAVQGDSVDIIGNIIGLNASGDASIGNSLIGVYLSSDNSSIIDNVISGNGYAGMAVLGDFNVVQSNKIGALVDGSDGVVGSPSGIIIAASAADNIIGGTNTTEANTIAYNQTGISVISISIASLVPDSNTLIGNSIYNNSVMGIDLVDDSNGDQSPDTDLGPNLNDANDIDTGSNDYLNFPVVNSTSATKGSLIIDFDLDVDDTATNGYRIEFYANSSADINGYGQGEFYLGSKDIAASVAGEIATLTIPTTFSDGSYAITATTTEKDASTDGFGSTSEFSAILGDQTIMAAIISDDTNTNNNSNGGNLANTGQSVRLVSAIATLVIIGAGYAIKRAGINSRN